MLDRLPSEIVQHILNYLLILRYEKYTGSSNSHAGFVNLRTWNEISNFSDILSLAHTCRYIKLITYPVIFKAWAHVDEEYGAFMNKQNGIVCHKGIPFFYSGIRWACFFLPRVRYSDYQLLYTYKRFRPEQLKSLLNPTCKPRFYIAGSDMLSGALQYIQHLSLSFNGSRVAYSEWLPDYLFKMKALKEVTINMEGTFPKGASVDLVKDFELVIELLRNHHDTLIVHTHMKLWFKDEHILCEYLENFQNSWRQWQSLVIETLAIEVRAFEYSIPETFSKMIGKLGHLKRFSIDIADAGKYCKSLNSKYNDPISKRLVLLPNLEELSIRLRCPRCRKSPKNELRTPPKKEYKKQPFPPRIHKLSWSAGIDDFFLRFENFDAVTFFEVYQPKCACFIPVKLPSFHKLETLVCTDCSWNRVETTINHCKGCSPYLVNLIIRNANGTVPEAKLQVILADITHMEIYQGQMSSKITFEMVVQNADSLCHLIYHDLSYKSKGIPWVWFEKHIYSMGTKIKTVQFCHSSRDFMPKTPGAWLKYHKIKTFGRKQPRGYTGILDEIVCGSRNDTFILDVPKLLQKLNMRNK